MVGDEERLGELQSAVLATPDNFELRGKLIEALLEAGEAVAAVEHVDALVKATPRTPWVLSLGIRTATQAGDNLRAARYRRDLRECVDDDDTDQDNGRPSVPHPSRRDAPHTLRLLLGGASDPATSLSTAQRHLDDMVGVETIKRKITQLVRTALEGNQKGAGWDGGTLLYGPPNCGKGFAVEVIAGELDAPLWSFDLDGKWYPDRFASLVRHVLDDGARGHRSVLYLTNLDSENAGALAPHILAELDAAEHIVVLGAATYPWNVSPQIVRPGRLGQVLLVLPPDEPSRRVFLTTRFELHGADAEDVDWLIKHTDGHSFADLDRLVEAAIAMSFKETAFRETAFQETDGERPLINHDAIRHARRLVAASCAEWLNTAGHHAMMNQTAGLYDDLLAYFRQRQTR